MLPRFYLHASLIMMTPQGADADDFNPDRFIGPDGKLLPAPPDTRDGMFLHHG